MAKWKGGQSRHRIGYTKQRNGELSLKSYARYWDVPYGKLYYRVAIEGMSIDQALDDLNVNAVSKISSSLARGDF